MNYIFILVGGVAQAFSEQGGGVINSDQGGREHLQHQHGHWSSQTWRRTQGWQ